MPTHDENVHNSGQLAILVYDSLRKLARAQLRRESPNATLQPTALVHEVYVRLSSDDSTTWDSEGHFFVAASRAMKRILVERARARNAQKRGGGRLRLDAVGLDYVAAEDRPEEILALDSALDRLLIEDEQKAVIVELKFFGGMTIPEIACSLGVSESTVKREWRFARAWLRVNL